MENIKDFVDWLVWILVAVVGWFLNRTVNKIERTQETHEKRLSRVETEVAVIGKSVDNNFATLSSSIDNLQTQLSEIKALLIEQIKDNKQ